MQNLTEIVELSHEFGSDKYVRGGGGNTSVKDDATLWVKPSGTTLAGLTAETFVAMDRARINELYSVTPPAAPAAREELVKNMMAAAVENTAGRPSVEAPLHNVFAARFVVHTHPYLVNGMTCARDGAGACRKLFPEALWVEYIDPGYTLCMIVRERIAEYRQEHGHDPKLLVLQNHGIFVAADTVAEIRSLYAEVIEKLKTAYAAAGVTDEIAVADAAADATEAALIQTLFGDDAASVVSAGKFAYTNGPVTPDHIVYAKSFPFTSELTAEAVAAYKQTRGYAPKVVITDSRVYGIGNSDKNARLALELALDGAIVMKLAEAFGGLEYMTDHAREFIENWEVESYRQKQV